jgi:long-chain acyl-CoA synthetase
MTRLTSPEPTTLPQLLRRNAETIARRPAIREKDRGIWQTYGWADYARHVEDFALGLAAAGFGRSDKLAVVGDNRPRLYWAQLAAQSLGGIAVPVYQDSIAAELVYVLNHAEVSVIVAEDQEQVDKVLSVAGQLPKLKLLVYDDPRGLDVYNQELLRSFAALQEAGRAFGASHPGYLDAAIARIAPDDVALLTYTSGTTGKPKGAMLSHANLLSAAAAFMSAEDIRPSDEWLCYLPMAWVGDALYSTVLSLLVGFPCNCPENPETVQRDLRELGPTALIAPPRIWENVLANVQVRAADATPLKRRLFAFFLRVAENAQIKRADAKPIPALARLGLALGEILVYRPLRDRLGLARTRWAYTGGAPLGADAYRFFRAIGVNLKQIYGATELSGLASLQPDGEADPNTVGRICPGIEVQIADDGEVLIRSGGVFKGYYNQPEATAGAFAADGWFRTGDAGFLDPRGNLVIVDRAKDVGKLADGTVFAPQFVENKLKYSPFVAEAVAFGDEQPFVAAMIAIDMTTVGNWAERRNLAYTSFQDLAAKPEVRALIREEIGKCNATLPAVARIRRFLLLAKPLEADDEEVTRTRKVRRRFITEKYGAVIDGFYHGKPEVELVTDITYEDGRKATLKTVAVIEDVETAAVAPAARRELAHV